MVTSMHIDPNKMVTIKIDGIPVTVPSGTTIMEAAGKSASKFLPSATIQTWVSAHFAASAW